MTTDPMLSTSSALGNGTATTSSSPIQVSAGAGVIFGTEKVGSLLAVGIAVLAAF
jgi:hypothetical protein